MLLKRISQHLCPHLREYLEVLAGIKTTENLIYTSLPTLSSLLPSIPRDDLEDLIEECISLTAPSCNDGWSVYDQRTGKGKEKESKKVVWGLSKLDGIIDEWDWIGIVELSGPRRVGKSLLALHAALRILHHEPESICHWLDTDGSFPPDRAKSILESMGVKNTTSILSRLLVTPCFNLDPDLYQVLDTIRTSLENGNGGIVMIVLDQVTALFKDQLINTNSAGQAAMMGVMEDLAEITYSYGLTTFVINAHATSVPTNPLSRFSATAIKPALGSSFTFTSDISLLLQETGKLFGMVDEGERERIRTAPGLRAVVEVLKSRVSPAGRWTVIETDGTRLLDVSPPPNEDEQTIRQSAGLPIGDERPSIGSLAQTLRP